MDKVERVKQLVKQLNESRDHYYNTADSKLSDSEYDKLFDELVLLEKDTNYILNNSPTQSVGYKVQSKLEKAIHTYPLLSLEKTKDFSVAQKFIGKNNSLLMWKADGLTIELIYENGILQQGSTRGDGEEGSLITDNVKTFKNVPQRINYMKHLKITGEAIIHIDDFEKINSKLSEDDKYRTPRNLASGSVQQLDSSKCAERNLYFYAFNVIEGMDEENSLNQKLMNIQELGFDTVSYIPLWVNKFSFESTVNYYRNYATQCNFPIDGLVVMYDDITYGKSLGRTSHHYLNGLAIKFEDETVETTLLDIEWSPSRTGLLNPVAIFSPIEIDGTTVSRASLSNISIMEDLELGIGDTIEVSKRNQIIPKVEENITRSNTFTIPSKCPECNADTMAVKDNDSIVLYCTNPDCKSKLIGKLVHFCDKNSMNIDGISESTLEKFFDLGWLTCLSDIYNLSNHKSIIVGMDGFGIKSYNNIVAAIEKSKDTKVESFIRSLGINNIGRSQSKELSKKFNNNWYQFTQAIMDEYDFTQIEGFGEVLNRSIYNWYENFKNSKDVNLADIMNFKSNKEEVVNNNKPLEGKSICITGKLIKYPNRDALVKDIELYGGKEASGVTKVTDYLLTNDTTSGSSKNKKAEQLGIPIITEEQFTAMINK